MRPIGTTTDGNPSTPMKPEPRDQLDVAARRPVDLDRAVHDRARVVVRERRCRHHRAQEQVVVLEPPVPQLPQVVALHLAAEHREV